MNEDVARLVERLEYTAKNGLLQAANDRMYATHEDAASTIRALDAKLREAVELLKAVREETAALLTRYDDQEQSNHPHVYVLLKRLDAFLATMEKTNG